MKIPFTLSLILLVSISAKSQTVQANMPVVKGKIHSIVRYENTVYIGGEFDSVGGIYKPKLAAFDAITGVVLSWDPQPNGNVYRLLLADGKLIISGSFSTISTSTVSGIAMYELPSLNFVNVNNSNAGGCKALFYDGNQFVYYYSGFGNINRFHINTGFDDLSWSIPLNFGNVSSIHGSQNHIYVAGDNLSNFPNNKDKLVRGSISTGEIDTSFYFTFGGSSIWGQEVLYYNNKIYLTGSFNSVNGLTRKGIVEIDTTGNIAPLNIYCSNQQNYALFPQGNTLWIGGNSASIGSGSSYRIAQVNINTGYATCWSNNGMSGYSYVKSIWVTNDTVYAAGSENYVNQGSFKVFNGNDSWTTLGPDTVICPGNSYTINADPTFASYLWNTGAITSSITVNAAGNYWVTGTRANNCKATDSINVDFCTSVENLSGTSIYELNIFPNPVLSEINISFYSEKSEYVEMEIYNSLGQSIAQIYGNKSAVGLNEFKFTTHKLERGMYLLKIKNSSMNLMGKIIKL